MVNCYTNTIITMAYENMNFSRLLKILSLCLWEQQMAAKLVLPNMCVHTRPMSPGFPDIDPSE